MQITKTRNSDNNDNSKHYNKLTAQDYEAIFMLVVLYSIQGCILGFFNYSIMVIFAEQKVNISYLAPLSFTSYPYTFKILFAPFVDCYYSPTFGKRKSYIVPVQYLLSALLFYTAATIEIHIYNQSIWTLTGIGLVLCSLISLQDVAVDGWAIKLFKPENIYYGSISQSIGMGLGFVTSTAIYFLLAKIQLPNQSEPFFNASIYFLSLATFLLILTLYVHILIIEKTEDNDFQISELSAKKGLIEIYSVFVGFCKNKHLRYLLIFIFIYRWGYTPMQSVDNLIFVQNGLKKETLSKITMYLSPCMFLFPIIMARYILLQVPGQEFNEPGFYFYILILLSLIDFWHFSQSILIIQTFFNIIASKGFESTYVTSLSSANNFGRQVSETTFLAIYSSVNFELAVGIGWVFTAILIYQSADKLEELGKLNKKDWEIEQIGVKGVEKDDKEL